MISAPSAWATQPATATIMRPPSAAFAVYYRHWGMLALYLYYLAVNCYGLYLWRKQDADNR